jgi:predicted aspartyl protease
LAGLFGVQASACDFFCPSFARRGLDSEMGCALIVLAAWSIIMGLVHAHIQLANPRNGGLKPIAVNALVDTGAMTLCIPKRVAVQLGLEEIEKRAVTTGGTVR